MNSAKIDYEARMEQARQRELNAYIQYFLREHTPSDPERAAEFNADLIKMVGAIHKDAAREYRKLIELQLAAQDLRLTIRKDIL